MRLSVCACVEINQRKYFIDNLACQLCFRGLLYWLKCNAHQRTDHGKDSPLTLAANMFTGKQAYADVFSELCQ